MKQISVRMLQKRYLLKKEVLSYYYNTYVGLAIIFFLLITIKFHMLPYLLSGFLIILVILKIVSGTKKMIHKICCPYCGAGGRKRHVFSNVHYLSTLPLEKEEFICPECQNKIEIREME